MFATAKEVLDITGKSVSHAQIRQAQHVIEAYTGRRADDDHSDTDAYWLRLATAYQVAFEEEDTGSAVEGVKSLKQGDLSVTFEEGAGTDIAPKAARVLRRLQGRGVRSVPVGSLYRYPVYEQGWEPIF